VAQHALDNSPHNLLRLALATSKPPVMRSGRLERTPA
jgi:hypothetical protein